MTSFYPNPDFLESAIASLMEALGMGRKEAKEKVEKEIKKHEGNVQNEKEFMDMLTKKRRQKVNPPLDAEQRAIMEGSKKYAATIRKHGGSTDKEAVLAAAKEEGVGIKQIGENVHGKPIWTIKNIWEKSRGGPVKKNKRPQMMKGGSYKGKKHSYAAGGKVNKLNF